MIIIYTKHFPPKGYKAINIFGFVFSKGPLTPVQTLHEALHIAQMKETLYVFFYLIYVIEFIIKLLITFNWRRAYYSVSFEQEAYENVRPVSSRKPYGWIKYLTKLTSRL